jgi:hypothetical protein
MLKMRINYIRSSGSSGRCQVSTRSGKETGKMVYEEVEVER